MKKRILPFLVIAILLLSAFTSSAATLKTFTANPDEWKVYLWQSQELNTDKEKIVKGDDGSYTAGYFTTCDDLYIGTYDFSKGMPTKFTIEYADQTDYNGSPQGVFYIVVGSNIDGADKWWSGEFNTNGTGDYSKYEKQTFDLLGGKWGYGYGGGDKVLPTGVQKVYLEMSTWYGNIKSVTFSNDKPEPTSTDNTSSTPNPATGDVGMMGAFAVALISSGSLIYLKKRNK